MVAFSARYNKRMRTSISNERASYLKYEIREVVDVVQKLKEIDPGFQVVGENIGDPIVKGWRVPQFLKDILVQEIRRDGDAVFGYSHSRGNPDVRKWVVELSRKLCPGSKLEYEYVLFTNGLGAAIASLYQMMPKGARFLEPSPTYPSHASMESFNAQAEPLFYRLNPQKNWEPDIEHMEAQIQKHPDVAGIVVISPNNPTGSVYSRTVLEQIVGLAEKYKLMILADEIYFRMVYNGHTFVHLTELALDRAPLIIMRGVSKDVPWPGGRSGWLEFHNVHLDPDFRKYCEAVKKRVLLEVCSVTLPQHIIPKFYDHPEFPDWNRQYNKELERNGNMISEILEQVESLYVNRPDGAFYIMPLFRAGILNDRQTLTIRNPEIRRVIEHEVAKPGTAHDKRFAYYLLGATGICVVPASGFFGPYPGFRITTLERNTEKLKDTYTRLAQAVREYTAE